MYNNCMIQRKYIQIILGIVKLIYILFIFTIISELIPYIILANSLEFIYYINITEFFIYKWYLVCIILFYIIILFAILALMLFTLRPIIPILFTLIPMMLILIIFTVFIILLHCVLIFYIIEEKDLQNYTIQYWYPMYTYKKYNVEHYGRETILYYYKTYIMNKFTVSINNIEYVCISTNINLLQNIPLLFDKYYLKSVEDYKNIPLKDNMTLTYTQCYYTTGSTKYRSTHYVDVYEVYITDYQTNIQYYTCVNKTTLLKKIISSYKWRNDPLSNNIDTFIKCFTYILYGVFVVICCLLIYQWFFQK